MHKIINATKRELEQLYLSKDKINEEKLKGDLEFLYYEYLKAKKVEIFFFDSPKAISESNQIINFDEYDFFQSKLCPIVCAESDKQNLIPCDTLIDNVIIPTINNKLKSKFVSLFSRDNSSYIRYMFLRKIDHIEMGSTKDIMFFNKMIDIYTNCFSILFGKNSVLVSRRPQKICKDAFGFLHTDKKSENVIEFSDGWGISID